jgi:hypothetical protein
VTATMHDTVNDLDEAPTVDAGTAAAPVTFDGIVSQLEATTVPEPTTEPMAAELLGTDVAPLALLNTRALAAIPPMEWLVGRHMPAGLLTVLWGQGGSFKSFLALDWALCVASGTPWQGENVEQESVIFISGEGASGLYSRVEAWEQDNPAADTRLFAVVPHAVRLLDLHDVKRLRKTIGLLRRKPGLIVIDTLQRAMAGLGDENSTQDVSRLISVVDQLREEFGCAVLLVHHSGADGARARGNSVLRNSADAMWALKRDGEPGSMTPTATLVCDKVKDEEEQPGRSLVAVRSASSIVLKPGTAAPAIGARYHTRPF